MPGDAEICALLEKGDVKLASTALDATPTFAPEDRHYVGATLGGLTMLQFFENRYPLAKGTDFDQDSYLIEMLWVVKSEEVLAWMVAHYGLSRWHLVERECDVRPGDPISSAFFEDDGVPLLVKLAWWDKHLGGLAEPDFNKHVLDALGNISCLKSWIWLVDHALAFPLNPQDKELAVKAVEQSWHEFEPELPREQILKLGVDPDMLCCTICGEPSAKITQACTRCRKPICDGCVEKFHEVSGDGAGGSCTCDLCDRVHCRECMAECHYCSNDGTASNLCLGCADGILTHVDCPRHERWYYCSDEHPDLEMDYPKGSCPACGANRS